LEDLPPKGEIRRYQVTLKLAILPQDKHHVKTAKTHHDSKNPTFNEDFEFSLDKVSGHTLRISACDAAVHGKYDAVGHALFDLDELVMQTRPKTFKLKLYKYSEASI
jgi:Ca2+-dependent lipid-binding protein